MCDASGTTAIEFALVAAPFFLMMLGTANTGMYYFAVNTLDRGVEDASRKVRTGEAQKSNVTVAQFKTMVCSLAISQTDCMANTQIHLQFSNSWANLQQQSCLANGNLAGGTGTGTDALSTYVGTASQVVMVTACYKWSGSKAFRYNNGPLITFGNPTFTDGSLLIQSSTAFTTEPYI
jgi:Flp pilus assembly protein TadG